MPNEISQFQSCHSVARWVSVNLKNWKMLHQNEAPFIIMILVKSLYFPSFSSSSWLIKKSHMNTLCCCLDSPELSSRARVSKQRKITSREHNSCRLMDISCFFASCFSCCVDLLWKSFFLAESLRDTIERKSAKGSMAKNIKCCWKNTAFKPNSRQANKHCVLLDKLTFLIQQWRFFLVFQSNLLNYILTQ